MSSANPSKLDELKSRIDTLVQKQNQTMGMYAYGGMSDTEAEEYDERRALITRLRREADGEMESE
jgi:hypothetical protein